MATVLSPPEEKVLLYDVSWETYEQLLANYENSSGPRFTYDQGILEIMSPSSEHEAVNDVVKQLVNILAEEMELDIKGFGSTTFRREDLGRGAEPDSYFYIQSADQIRGVNKLNLDVHPAPDLVIEIDLTSPSIDKFSFYASIGVSEIWHYEEQRLEIFQLQNESYMPSEESQALPLVRAAALTQFVKESESTKRPDWIRAVRQWARSLLC